MGLKLRMIGTGSAFAKTFYNNNALLESGGQTLLLDCGITAPRALYEIGVSYDQLDAVLITHIHADHVGGLEELAFQMKFLYRRKPRLFVAEELIVPLWEHTLRGGLQQDGVGESLDAYFDVRPIAPNELFEPIPGLEAELIQTPHIPNKLSYSLLMKNSIFYTADMVHQPELLERLIEERGVRTIFHDCQLNPPGVVHASLSQLLTLPEAIQERIYLMHYGDDQPTFVGKTGRMTFVEQNRVYEFE
ncbi:MBL fold metallo-hydrolase [Cohnella faecalis]|uniref:Ribonuclease Z n=1 Tax=Cohnella faecalis TaxID=2315694 RepID=A0A398CSU6_9BACL|nr:MBL fold metallo-hydrolase [Cohnella faecalis]RIE04329.1 ribonuclease Z [Cohnella faecalis]